MRSIAVERIPHRELRNSSSEILRRVAAGKSFEITNHGAVVAVLNPPSTTTPALEVVRRATRRGGWSDLRLATPGRPTQEILDELRQETR